MGHRQDTGLNIWKYKELSKGNREPGILAGWEDSLVIYLLRQNLVLPGWP